MAISDRIHTAWQVTIDPLIDRLIVDIDHDFRARSLSYKEIMDAYTSCYDILIMNIQDEDVQQFHIRQVERLDRYCQTLSFSTVDEFLVAWDRYNLLLKWMRIFFHYANRLYGRIVSNDDRLPHIFYTSFLQTHVDHLFSIIIQNLRGESPPQYESIVRILSICEDLDPDLPHRFHLYFLKGLAIHYQSIDHASLDIYRYMEEVVSWLDQEYKMSARLNMTLICWTAHQEIFIESVIRKRCEESMACFLESLSSIETHYQFLRFTHLADMKRVYKTYLIRLMGELVIDSPEIVSDMMSIDSMQKNLVHGVFEEDNDFATILYDAWRGFFQKQQTKIILLLVRAVDRAMAHKNTETIPDILVFFDYLSDKDLFLHKYRELMSHRLLLEHPDFEEEMTVVSILIVKMGNSYVTPLCAMINETRIHHRLIRENGPVRSTNMVVSHTQWGWTVDKAEYRLPPVIQEELDAYSSQCADVFGSNKRFVMLYRAGMVRLRARFNDTAVYEMMMTPVQAIVLLAVAESAAPITIEALDQKIVVRGESPTEAILHSLTGIVKKTCEGWRINHAFSSKRRVHKIKPVVVRETVQKQEDSIILNRSHIIDSTIVRIMKTRRRLSHSQLLVDTVSHIKLFEPEVSLIKTRIEDLMNRDFIERESHDMNTYVYIA
jgi:hypothetical protein